MTYEMLIKIMKKNNIPENCEFRSDSGWECSSSDMDGMYYNKKLNVMIFTQLQCPPDIYNNNPDWCRLN